MIDDKPSITAAAVAWARAATDEQDEITKWLVPRGYHAFLSATASERVGKKASTAIRRVVSGGLTDHMRLRTAAIDGLLEQAVNVGVEQLVLLGAGLDARAYRLAWLADVTVFEVDHPASQQYKQRKVAKSVVACGSLTHVAVDFACESLPDKLTAAGFDPHKPAFWIWEGVTMYLPRATTSATLAAIASLSCAGSRIVATYMLPEQFGNGVWSRRVKQLFSALDEPLVGGMTPAEMRSMLREHGFKALADGSNSDWAQQLGASGAGWALLFRSERMAVAEC
jgi:methyltransferase (TIGR00027 family)